MVKQTLQWHPVSVWIVALIPGCTSVGKRLNIWALSFLLYKRHIITVSTSQQVGLILLLDETIHIKLYKHIKDYRTDYSNFINENPKFYDCGLMDD